MLSYLRRHWRGDLPVALAFWVNLVLGRVAMSLLAILVQTETPQGPVPMLPAAVLFHAVDLLIVLPWQVVGAVRATDRLLQQSGNSGLILGSHIGIAFCALLAGVGAFSAFQPLLNPAPEEPMHVTWERERASRYTLSVGPEGRRLFIAGRMELGLTKRLRAVLDANPGVEAVILDSPGGLVAQGRAVGVAVAEYGLDTYVFGRCLSACTLAFAGGERRYLGPRARIGFHQYVYDGRNAHPFIDYEAVYARDRAFFESRGISPAFLDSAFEAPHSAIWYPGADRLIEAGFAHGRARPGG
jgi:hypothetical protein